METLFIYLLKSSGLIAVFYISYHFLVRKETFFNSSRWFLITGLFTSLLLPLFSIKKIVYMERPKVALEDLIAYSKASSATVKEIPTVEAFDWMQFIWVSYILIASVLIIKIVLNLLSLYRMLYKQQVVKKENFKLVDINENIAPFSFFTYIVYNSNLYSSEELQSILLHEKIHSQEKHSMDVLIAKLFCIVFWFNPFIWLYKKAITQNLEYIADQKAIHQLEDKKAYQKALLKVVSNQSCLSITNNFYQPCLPAGRSLIKKRIVMLNTNQSHKKNSWKYALVIPALIGFVLLFQIKTIAQEKEPSTFARHSQRDEVRVVTSKNSSDDEMKKDAALLKEKYGITLKFSKVKRNAAGEITGIKVEFKDKKGNKGVSQVNGEKPIQPIHFYKNDEAIGFGTPRSVRVYANTGGGEEERSFAFNFDDSIPDMSKFNFDIEVPDAPESPEAPELAELPEMAEMAAIAGGGENSKIIIKKNGKKPIVIINGKLADGSDLSPKEKEELENSIKMDEDGEDTQIIINGQDMAKIRKDAMKNAQIQIRRMPQIKAQVRRDMERAREDLERARPEMERAREEIELSRPDIEQAKAEMIQAKEEMQKARAEMQQAKSELEKAKADLKKK